MQARLALREELGSAPWLREGGNLVWMNQGEWSDSAENEADLETRIAELHGWTTRPTGSAAPRPSSWSRTCASAPPSSSPSSP